MSKKSIRSVSALGPHIRSLRLARGYTRTQLAQRARSPLHTIQQIEQGLLSPRTSTLYQLCYALEIAFSEFVEGLCRQAQGPRAQAQDRPAGHTPDQRRAALLASGQGTRCNDDALGW
jgi:transcriptional regulator with XRE-family HTH domain